MSPQIRKKTKILNQDDPLRKQVKMPEKKFLRAQLRIQTQGQRRAPWNGGPYYWALYHVNDHEKFRGCW